MELVTFFAGKLNTLYLLQDRVAAEKTTAYKYLSWDLTLPQLIQVELLLGRVFSLLDGFMSHNDLEAVPESMQLADGSFRPLPWHDNLKKEEEV